MRPARHAGRRPHRQHRDRRRQPAHRRRDRPHQQAVAADRGRRSLAGRARARSSLACTAIPLAMALTQGAVETVAVAAGLAVGALYSLPPFRLKRFPVAASLCITGVRSDRRQPRRLLALRGRHLAAGVGAVPVRAAVQLRDRGAQGRARPRGRPAVLRSARSRSGSAPSGCSRSGLAALAIAYGGMIVLGPLLLARSRAAGRPRRAATLPPRRCSGTGPDRRIRATATGFTRFYMRVWALFFLEYVLVPIACLAA